MGGRKPAPLFTPGRVNMIKDLEAFAHRVVAPVVGFKRAVGLDLGTNCGVAFVDFRPGAPLRDLTLLLGQWDLSVGPYDTGILRLVRLKQFLSILNPDLVAYEEVKFDPPQDLMQKRGGGMGAVVARVSTAAEFLGSLKATVAIWCHEHNVPAHGLAITQIKKYATNKGNSGKKEMIEAANAQFGLQFETENYEKTGVDNICDAAFCCKMGLEMYAEGLPT